MDEDTAIWLAQAMLDFEAELVWWTTRDGLASIPVLWPLRATARLEGDPVPKRRRRRRTRP